MNEVMCDFCSVMFPIEDRHVAAVSRPSDPQELVAVLWACPACGKAENMPSAQELITAVEAGQPVNGQKYLFVSV